MLNSVIVLALSKCKREICFSNGIRFLLVLLLHHHYCSAFLVSHDFPSRSCNCQALLYVVTIVCVILYICKAGFCGIDRPFIVLYYLQVVFGQPSLFYAVSATVFASFALYYQSLLAMLFWLLLLYFILRCSNLFFVSRCVQA